MTSSLETSTALEPRGDRSYLLLLILLNMASQGLLGLISPLTKEISADLHITLLDIGYIQTLFLIAYALSTPLWAVAAAHCSRHRILVVVSLLWSCACLFMTRTHDPTWFAIGFAVAAVGNAGVLPTTFSMAIDVVPFNRRGAAFGWLGTAQTLSLGVAFMVGGMLGEKHGWRLPFTIFGMLGISSVITLLTWKRYEPRHGAMEGELQSLFEVGKAYDYRLRWTDLRILLSPFSNCWLVTVTMLHAIPSGAVNFWFIAMLRHDHLLSARHATLLLIALFCIQVPGAVIAGRWADRADQKWDGGKVRLLAGFTLATVPCFATAFLLPWQTPATTPIAFGFFLILVVMGAFSTCAVPPLTYNTIGDINPPERRSVVFAFISISRLVGRAIGIQLATLIGFLWYANAISPGIGWVVFFSIPASLCCLPVLRSNRRDRQALEAHLRDYVATNTDHCAA